MEFNFGQVVRAYMSDIKYQSTCRQIPINLYDEMKKYIDHTKYRVIFRGPRINGNRSTLKAHATHFDIYKRNKRNYSI